MIRSIILAGDVNHGSCGWGVRRLSSLKIEEYHLSGTGQKSPEATLPIPRKFRRSTDDHFQGKMEPGRTPTRELCDICFLLFSATARFPSFHQRAKVEHNGASLAAALCPLTAHGSSNVPVRRKEHLNQKRKKIGVKYYAKNVKFTYMFSHWCN